jgi:hypothetical protein
MLRGDCLSCSLAPSPCPFRHAKSQWYRCRRGWHRTRRHRIGDVNRISRVHGCTVAMSQATAIGAPSTNKAANSSRLSPGAAGHRLFTNPRNDPLCLRGPFAKIEIAFGTTSIGTCVLDTQTAVATALGDVAQLGERSVRNAEVEGSTPFISTLWLSF